MRCFFKRTFGLIDFGQLRLIKEKEQFFIAFLLYVSSTGVVSSHFAILGLLLICLTKHKDINIAIYSRKTSFNIIGIIILLSFFNELTCLLIQSGSIDISPLELIPYSIFIALTMLASILVDRRVMKWLVLFTLIDVASAVFQKVIGINSFFAISAIDIAESDLLYDLKVNGLNTNSAGLGTKSFLLLIIYDFFKETHFIKKRLLIVLTALLGVVLAFNRTAIIGLISYFIIRSLKNKKLLILYTLIAGCIILFKTDAIDFILSQMTRGSGDLTGNSMSGREDVYAWFWAFIKENPLMGNGSFKLYMYDGEWAYHAHNAYLQTLATNGVIISLLYFWLLVRNITKSNLRFVFPIFICGIFQAFFLWGASYTDFIMWSILLGPIGSIKQNLCLKANQNYTIKDEKTNEGAVCLNENMY